VNSLCSKALWLDKGEVRSIGQVHEITNQYLGSYQRKQWKQSWANGNAPGNESVTMVSVELIPNVPEPGVTLNITHSITVKFAFINHMEGADLVTGLHLFTLSGECVFDVSTKPSVFEAGLVEGECSIPGNFLNDGSYYFSIIVVKDTSQPVFYLEECLHFDMEDFRENTNWYGKWQGYVRPQFPFTLTSKQIVP
jgi:lipopolysaccharide transport system ATP-binding protein